MNDARVVIPAVLISLNEGLKRTFGMPSKWAIVINWVLGVVLDILLQGRVGVSIVIEGFLIGSAAGGIYDIKKLFRSGENG